jgi:hypothetical protein
MIFSAIGFVNGQLRVVDSITLEDELAEPFRYARYAITQVAFSHDSQYIATAVSYLSSKLLAFKHDVFHTWTLVFKHYGWF